MSFLWGENYCRNCGAKITVEIVEHKFEYGVKDPLILTAIIPIEKCNDCDQMWYGEIGSMIIDYTVKKHLESLKG